MIDEHVELELKSEDWILMIVDIDFCQAMATQEMVFDALLMMMMMMMMK